MNPLETVPATTTESTVAVTVFVVSLSFRLNFPDVVTLFMLSTKSSLALSLASQCNYWSVTLLPFIVIVAFEVEGTFSLSLMVYVTTTDAVSPTAR